MKYVCKKCGFIHEGDMPDGYYCPVCRSNYSFFKLVEKEKIKYNRKTISKENICINRVLERCIGCGACTKTCENFECIKNDKVCVNCGQCILTCPTGALTPKYDYKTVLEYINDPEYTVIAMTSPAVRVGIGDAFGYKSGEFLEGKMVAALKQIGFDYVFDVSFGADLTSIEEAHELLLHIKKKEVMFSSCCPSWVSYAECFHPELVDSISSCKSPIGMEASVIKNIYLKEDNIDISKVILVAVTPCTSKKKEIENSDTDYVITTSELALMIRELDIDFKKLEDEKFDSVRGTSSGIMYGTSGGVTLSVIRCLYYELTGKDLSIDEVLIRNKEFYKEMKVKIKGDIYRFACVSTMVNLEKILEIKDEFTFIEVMNCNGGCIYGGGQILTPQVDKDRFVKSRSRGLINKDKNPNIKYPYKNPLIKDLYEDYLDEYGSKSAEKLLHKTAK